MKAVLLAVAALAACVSAIDTLRVARLRGEELGPAPKPREPALPTPFPAIPQTPLEIRRAVGEAKALVKTVTKSSKASKEYAARLVFAPEAHAAGEAARLVFLAHRT